MKFDMSFEIKNDFLFQAVINNTDSENKTPKNI